MQRRVSILVPLGARCADGAQHARQAQHSLGRHAAHKQPLNLQKALGVVSTGQQTLKLMQGPGREGSIFGAAQGAEALLAAGGLE